MAKIWGGLFTSNTNSNTTLIMDKYKLFKINNMNN